MCVELQHYAPICLCGMVLKHWDNLNFIFIWIQPTCHTMYISNQDTRSSFDKQDLPQFCSKCYCLCSYWAVRQASWTEPSHTELLMQEGMWWLPLWPEKWQSMHGMHWQKQCMTDCSHGLWCGSTHLYSPNRVRGKRSWGSSTYTALRYLRETGEEKKFMVPWNCSFQLRCFTVLFQLTFSWLMLYCFKLRSYL